MDLRKIEFLKKDHYLDPTALALRGTYSVSMELTIPKTEWDYRKDDAKQLIHDSIERQVSHDSMQLSFARGLDVEARQVIVSALMYSQMQFVMTAKDVKEKTEHYREFQFREQLIYALRSMKI